MISEGTIQEIKSKMSTLEVVQDFVKLKRAGANYVGICPFHNEKTGSFTVSPAKDIYKCFGCGKSGDAISFLMEHEKYSYLDSIGWLAKKYHVEISEMKGKKEYQKPVPRLEKVSKRIIDFFENRKISNNTLLRMKITEAKEWMPLHEKEVPVICFNYFRGEDLVNIKFRGPEFRDKEGKKKKSFKLSKDSEIIFYNLNGIQGESEAIIVEGEPDCLACVEAGIYNVVSVPNGTPPPDKKGNYSPKLEYLDNCWMDFEDKTKIIIATDNDFVGGLLREELACRLGKERCYQVQYPEGCKDSNDVLIHYGPEVLREMFEKATQWPIEGIIAPEDIRKEVEYYFKHGYPKGVPARIEGLDPLITFLPGHLTMWTGIPGHGKDEVTNWIATSISKHHEWPWGIFNFEEPAAIHTTKLMEKFSGKAFAFRSDEGARMSNLEFDRAIDMVEKYFHFVKVDEIDVTMEGIISKAVDLKKRFGIKGLIINPWNYLEHKRSAGQSESDYVSEVLTLLINFLWKHGVHCFLIAHPTKMNKDPKTGKYYVPTLYSISGSAHFFNKTHNGACVYRDYETGETYIHVQKVKWYWIGEIGWSTYMYNTETRQHSFLASSHYEKQRTDKNGIPTNFKPVKEIEQQANLFQYSNSMFTGNSVDEEEDPFPPYNEQ